MTGKRGCCMFSLKEGWRTTEVKQKFVTAKHKSNVIYKCLCMQSWRQPEYCE